MSTQVPVEPRRSPPSWMVPAGIGMIIVLLGVLIVVLGDPSGQWSKLW